MGIDLVGAPRWFKSLYRVVVGAIFVRLFVFVQCRAFWPYGPWPILQCLY